MNNGQLRSFIERVERLIEEKKAVADGISDVMAEAKASGYDTKIIRQVIAARAKDPNALSEEEQLFALYMSAMG